MEKNNLPIKIVLQRNEDIKPNMPGGKIKFFGEVNDKLQTTVIDKLKNLEEYYEDIFDYSEKIPVVGKIRVKKKAIAKSHKPERFCKDMPIIGAEHLDEIYFKVTKSGIKHTIEMINLLPSKEFKANLTTIEDITPYIDKDKISADLLNNCEKEGFEKIKNKIKIKLFDFQDDFDNALIEKYVNEQLEKLMLYEKAKIIKYGEKLKYIKVEVNTYDQIVQLSKINGIKKIDFFRKYNTKLSIKDENANKFISPENNNESNTIIGIIDGGISDKNPYLKNWIYKRECYVGEDYINTSHGTFIASMIQYGDELNNMPTNNKRFKFLDVVALPNSDEEYGLVDGISEEVLMDIIEEVVEKYNKEVKIWNMSLGNEAKVCNDSISDLGAFCDYIQEEYNVQFFLAIGNINNNNYRKWPANIQCDKCERLISPGDSVRAITVGSIAYKESSKSLVKKDEPSPFSRRGPGANFIVKPDVVDYGGNCTKTGEYIGIGMNGLDEYGNIIEDIGTSYSNPRIVRKFASLTDEMKDEDNLLAKAMLIHSARMSSRDIINDKNDLIKYYGFGMPENNIENILKCSENEVTLIFKQRVSIGSHLELMDFPYPQSLIKNGKYFGEICMTLAYNPPLDEEYGQEYCRANINVGLGPYRYKEDGSIKYKSVVPLEKKWEGKYEYEQVENGFKWSPIKSYYKIIKKGLDLADGWKLRVDLTPRYRTKILSQEFVLILTIKDPNNNSDIYSDVINGLSQNGYVTSNLELKNQIRLRN
ncbi:S8 family peptidase [Clostridium botulinum]|uniref:S8 family peptidase n=1 Tax=Clostridium botulinum TaxID=1491 RepID=UPI0007738341|nr:S8 family peptidase [Clostridium botulinum]NFF80408.1 S8 family peptidase [Clostridium botulinum]NFH80807.1 S8 family peptidase [Clostridium botulinum]NFH83184.1 S8 family peptidase [Clostridium botulinum]NFI12049.1 S8 family peptidase [Clostridium botulinum]NFI15802.1 S8 family peptidase [Clostridium botulinum]